MRSMRNTKKLLGTSLMSKEMNFQLAHCEQNLIDLESDSDDSYFNGATSTDEEAAGPESARALNANTTDPN